MKKLVVISFLLATNLISGTASAKGFLDFRKPFERCGDLMQNFSSYKEYLPLCATLVTEEPVDCLESVVNHSGSISKATFNACKFVNNKMAAEAVEYYAKNYSTIRYDMITTLSFIDNEAESDCVQRTLGIGSFSLNDLSACMQEPKNAQEDRQYEALGIARPTPKNAVKGLIEEIKNWWNG